jgi:large subunit ribosomal protein L15
MTLLELRSKSGKKNRKRVGRGNGSGHGTFSTKGCKGQTARSGGRVRPGVEGGQTPLSRLMPKLKGFKSPCRKYYQIVNVGSLNIFENNATITGETLAEKHLIHKKDGLVKLLAGKGKLEKALKITVNKASASAVKEIEDLKGTVTLIIRKEKENA